LRKAGSSLAILQSYAVEAKIDPGAVVINGEETELGRF